ncbi:MULTISPECIES: TetR family transcriptional regulator [Staphylococcus]|uniref:Biofilm operon icaADBC HTH-type negative transcriptional regulator IcaR n=1 Tax=Staphylococcus caprae TaxID=29380 RepID=Q9AIQ9_9STAP|nr:MULTISPECIES: TetR family transcriptional regulator [Staphylococcus]AAK18070.1 IcaR [Staphylococcus caprae]EES41443.1 biofilm operon icaABCD HTH-type negative transcriptional regulator IcaR [Staphylococcus caprae M23864:W1]MBN6826522.1 TetR family transcriptional regulator [Staphylococcus caprae]MBU5272461.1 TetR family transcriptional regulator [Staphylococcus caprae]MBX5317191.1 TetR family transcriptional regulator [Staphylococcus caprae]
MKNKIIDNAITLFSEKGYYGTTLDDIAKSVNIKKASLYYHYSNKEEIYRKSVENCFNYFKTFILENNSDSNYSIDGLYQFLFEFIFDIDERYIRLYVQLSSAPDELTPEIHNHLKEVNEVLDSEIIRYYDPSEMSMGKEDFQNLILLFLESWYLRASFSQKFGVIEENKNCYKDQVYSLLNVFVKNNFGN